MQQTWLYRAQHAALVHLAAKLDEQIASNVPGSLLRLMLTAFADQLDAHLRVEDDVLYPRLVADADAAVAALAAAYQSEMGGLAAAFRSFNEKWYDGAAIDANVSEFAAEWRHVRRAIERRVDAEDCELYALVDALSERSGSSNGAHAEERTV